MRYPFESRRPLPSLLAAALLAACSGEKTPSPSASDAEALLTGAKWKLSAHTISPAIDWDGDGTMVTNMYAVNGDCVHDDIATYAPDHTFTIDEGAGKCDPSDPQQEKGTWSLDDAGDRLTLDSEIDAEPVVMRLAGINPSKLILTRTQTWPEDGITHTETFTFAAQ